jgi:N-acetyl-alpha-D-muramate 1-phosphate uridylyltransferase
VNKINAAMIMGAGLGIRMRPLTDDRPKPLVTVGGRALIDHTLDRLVAAGIGLAVVNVHYKAQMLRAHLAKRCDIRIVISDESDNLLDTGGGVVKALAHFGKSPFFVLNSDSLWTEKAGSALCAMMSRWDQSRMDGLLLLANLGTSLGYEGTGDFALKPDGHLVRARDGGHSDDLYAYPGVQIVHPRLFDCAPVGAFSTNLMWDRAIAKNRLLGIVLDGVWIHVGTPEARENAQAYLAAQPSVSKAPA